MKKFFVLIILAILFSCQKDPYDFDLKVKSAETVLCMSGFVSTDSIYVILSKNLPRDFVFSGGNPFILKDTLGEINVYENDVFFCRLQPKTILINSGHPNEYPKVYYVSHKKVTEGNTYTINGSHVDFESVSAKTTVPSIVPIISVDTFTYYKHIVYTPSYLDTFTNRIDTLIQYTILTVNFQDPPGYLNYYKVEITKKSGYTESYLFDPILEYKTFANLFTDKLIQGKKYGFQYSTQSDDIDSLLFRLYSLNEDYFKYCVSVDKFLAKTTDTYKEPVSIYSNINNGLGIIGGYTVSSVSLFNP